MADTINGAAETPEPHDTRSRTSDDELHDRVIFGQELYEVYLLIDHVSGRADRNLSSLTVPNPNKGMPNEGDTLSSGEIVKKIAAMRYPPDPATPVANAENAAVLLLTKDRLTALAHPARGFTIAYTELFADAEAGSARFRRPARPAPPVGGRHGHNGPAAQHAGGDSRVTVAARAFPGLQAHARSFRKWRDHLAFFSIIWLVLTALTYWDAGLARSVLQRLDQDSKSISSLEEANPQLFDDARCQSADANNAYVNQRGTPPANRSADDAKTALACRSLAGHRDARQVAIAEVNNIFRCAEATDSGYLGTTLHALHKVIHIWCWRGIILAGNNDNPPLTAAATAGGQAIDWQTATSILSVFTTYVLPMMFALLGTLMGSFRSIVRKIRDSELEPRDFMRMRLGIPMGLVAGVAVGLFLSPSSVPAEGSGSVAGDLTLTASGLGFLAGYCSHSFFSYLENVVNSVFPNTSGASSSAPQAAAPAAAAAAAQN